MIVARRCWRSRAGRGLILFLLAGGYLLVGIDRYPNIFDEGLAVLAAGRVLDGDVPYRDFWTLYGPGGPYLLAGAFRVGGTTLLTARLASGVLVAALGLAVYALARRLVPGWVALGVWAVWVLRAGAYSGYGGNPMHPALLASAVAVLIAVDGLAAPTRARLVATGVVLAVAGLFRPDLAAATGLALVLGLGVASWPHGPRASAVACAWMVGAGLAVSAMAAAVLVTHAGGAAPFEQLVRFPYMSARPGRSVAYPSPSVANLVFYLPIAVYAAAGLRWVVGPTRPPPVLLLGIWGLALVPYLLFRPDAAHVYPLFVPTLLLGAWALAGLRPRTPAGLGTWGLGAAAALALVASPLTAKAGMLVDRWQYAALRLEPLASERGGGVRWEGLPTYNYALAYVQCRVPPTERLFVASDRHDRVLTGDALFYFLSGHRPGTRYHEVGPGLTDTVPVQAAIVADLERHDVRWIVMRHDGVTGPPGVRILDDFIRARFTPEAAFGTYTVWRRGGDADGHAAAAACLPGPGGRRGDRARPSGRGHATAAAGGEYSLDTVLTGSLE